MKYEAIVETGEVIVRELTAEEIAQDEIDRQEALERKIKEDAEESSRLILLNKLGITEEEAKLLLS